MEKLELTLQKLKENGLKCNIKKSLFGKTDMEYLGFWVTWNGIRPINKNVEDIVIIMQPTTKLQLSKFSGLVNYYGVYGVQTVTFTTTLSYTHVR